MPRARAAEGGEEASAFTARSDLSPTDWLADARVMANKGSGALAEGGKSGSC